MFDERTPREIYLEQRLKEAELARDHWEEIANAGSNVIPNGTVVESNTFVESIPTSLHVPLFCKVSSKEKQDYRRSVIAIAHSAKGDIEVGYLINEEHLRYNKDPRDAISALAMTHKRFCQQLAMRYQQKG